MRLRHEMIAEPSVRQAGDSTCCVKFNKLHNFDRAESENQFKNAKTRTWQHLSKRKLVEGTKQMQNQLCICTSQTAQPALQGVIDYWQ